MLRITLFGLLIIFVIFRFITTRVSYPEGASLRITTRINTEPTVTNQFISFRIKNMKVILPSYLDLHYGDELTFEGKTEEGKIFNPKIVEIKKSTSFLYLLRRNIIDFYQTTLPQPDASLVAGESIGSKETLSPGFAQKLQRSGTIHTVVASGTNISLIAAFLVSFLAVFISRRKIILPLLIVIWLYALISGLDSPIVRASVMASIVFTSQLLGRIVSPFSVLALVFLVMLALNPDWVFDLGFWLSFSAVASLELFQKRIDQKLARVPTLIRESLSTNLAAQIGVLPILYFTFRYINILSPLANLLVLWTTPFIMTIGLVSGLISLFSDELAKPILYFAYPFTRWFVFVIERFG